MSNTISNQSSSNDLILNAPNTTAADDTSNFSLIVFFVENKLTFHVNHLQGR